jgi:hypothetical protein
VCIALDVPALPTRLLQGEILLNVVEYVPTGVVYDDGSPEIKGVLHPRLVVLTPACDLVSDYGERIKLAANGETAGTELNPKMLPHIQCCDLFLLDEIRYPYGFNHKTWSPVPGNRDERYHKVPVGDMDDLDHPDLYLDFKRIISLPTDYLYFKLNDGSTERRGVIPEPWINQLVQRCFGFQARVCVPDLSDPRPSAQV